MFKRILWAEEDSYFLRKFFQHLEKENYEIITRRNVQGVIELLNEDQKFDIVVIDLIFPQGDERPIRTYPGLDLIKFVRNRLKHVPIVVLSVARTQNTKAISKGADLFLHKVSTNPRTFTDHIKALLEKSTVCNSK